MEDKITIDKETLKAIASDTRLNILKSLEKKKKTLSDLSTELKLSNPTIKEHLEVLSKAGIVKKEESLRKWKYYSLSFKGKQLLKPNETKLFLALMISIIGVISFGIVMTLISTIGGIGSSNNLKMTEDMAQPEMIRSFAIDSSEALATTAKDAPTIVSSININIIILSLLIVVVITIFVLYIKEKNK